MRRTKSLCGPCRATIQIHVAARHESGLTQAVLADLLGKPPSSIAKIELGERRVDLVKFIAIARALGCAPEKLFVRISESVPE